MENEQNIIKIGEQDYEFADVVSYENNDYAVFLPAGENAEGQVEILKIQETEEKEAQIYDAVYEIFKTQNCDKYQFEE